jgi:phage internal scaffolding protein
MVKVRSYYDELQKVESLASAISFPEGEGRTKSEFKREVDINHIVKQYQQKGVMTHVSKALPQWAVEASSLTMQEAMIQIQQANEEFQRLPAELRKKFSNDPVNMLAFVADSKNYDKALEYGLVEKKPEPVIVQNPGAPIPTAPAPVSK